ncbi:hypothetical protein HHE01_04400 [Helicobacter heilmannii]|uniref:Uncharacterized protein n=1 Tax=Helicobacter heilmannii TaxID=35817 RepID=A0A0K2YAA8_HELHE|nr:hypothetical protein HHE01_04400 [Helicobacter heilmannii]
MYPLHFFTSPLFKTLCVAFFLKAVLSGFKRRGRCLKRGLKGSLWKMNI